jgi:phenol/toluene 2-monooxygenase (NADH) P1/A1
MSVEIKTAAIEPVRQTFSNIARRLGADKPASRYQEATFDMQSDCNFHYRPLWDPQRELYDRRRTAVVMKDWYDFKDPRQFYYGTYVLNRAKLQDTAENNFAFVEKHGAMAALPKGLTRRIKAIMLPLRHLEYAANLNNCYISAYGFGAAITNATTFAMMDRLGIAQYLSRIGWPTRPGSRCASSPRTASSSRTGSSCSSRRTWCTTGFSTRWSTAASVASCRRPAARWWRC